MNALYIGILCFGCFFGGAVIGTFLRNRLPGHHLSDDSRHLIEIGLGIIGTMAGLVLGLLVASASTSYNEQRTEVLDAASKIILLDRVLAHYGPETHAARRTLRLTVEQALSRMWPHERGAAARPTPASGSGEALLDAIESLSPTSPEEVSLKPQAVSLVIDLARERWLMFEQAEQSISAPLLGLLVFWFTITFIGFGLFAPPNATVLAALGLCALAVSGAIFITLEMYTPFEGLVRLSSAPLHQALLHLGR